MFRALGTRYKPELQDFPPMVMIDTTTRCNLACNHCPNKVLSKDRSWGGDMDWDLYKKIIDEIARENPKTKVRPFDSGEPLMRKDLGRLIKYTKDKGIQHVSINTNGTLLTERRALRLLESGLDHIEISVDAFSEEIFIRIKNLNYYHKLVKNIEHLIDLRDRLRPDFEISLSFVKQRDNLHEVSDFIEYWNNKVNHVTVRDYHQHGELVDGQGNYKEIKASHRPPCPYLWDRIIIEYDGRVRFCENDWKALHLVGNLNKHSLKQIWQSDSYRKLRESHIAGTFDHIYCKKCKDWKVIC
jgi:radical SAM protein with 4Fe4S-binding SPASM domain